MRQTKTFVFRVQTRFLPTISALSICRLGIIYYINFGTFVTCTHCVAFTANDQAITQTIYLHAHDPIHVIIS